MATFEVLSVSSPSMAVSEAGCLSMCPKRQPSPMTSTCCPSVDDLEPEQLPLNAVLYWYWTVSVPWPILPSRHQYVYLGLVHIAR